MNNAVKRQKFFRISSSPWTWFGTISFVPQIKGDGLADVSYKLEDYE